LIRPRTTSPLGGDPPLTALQAGVDGPNGVYAYGTTAAVPTNTYGDTNCCANVVYEPSPVQASQTISFTSTASSAATVCGATHTPTATSGLPVALTIDSSGSSVCSISGGVVSFIGVGGCVINANQVGNANWLAAAQVTQSVAVGHGASPTAIGSSLNPSTYGLSAHHPPLTLAATLSGGVLLTVSF
jgi:hypothetical protein